MPFLGRKRERHSRHRRLDDEFVVFLQGIPAHCRWQELKDLVRQTAVHIRQAVVYDDNHGFPTGLGQIIVKNEDEAWRTYHRLSTNGWEGQSLVVTLAHTSAPTRPIAGPTRSPPVMVQGYISRQSTPPRSQGNVTMPSSPISPDPTSQYPEYRHLMRPSVMPPQPFIPMIQDPVAQTMQGYPPSPMMQGSMYDGPNWNMTPMYPISPIQQFPHSTGHYPRYHPCKPRINLTGPSAPVGPSPHAAYTENAHAHTTPISLKGPWPMSNTVEQCNAPIMIHAHGTILQENASAIPLGAEETKQGTPAGDCHANVKTDRQPEVTRRGNYGRTISQKGLELYGPVTGGNGPGDLKREESAQEEAKPIVPDRPLVVDGSGLQKSY